jgi:hypothetical protein
MNKNEIDKKPFHSNEHKRTGNSNAGDTKKKIWIIIIIAVVLLGIVWVWKQVQLDHARKEAAAEKQQVQEQASKLFVQTNEQYLKLLAKPFVWAVRTEMMKGNISQVNLYANDMVKEKNFQSIVIADNKGLIVSSTNKKLEGKDFATIGKAAYLSGDTTRVDNVNDSLLVMSSPIMGFNNRLGTLMVTYALHKPALR